MSSENTYVSVIDKTSNCALSNQARRDGGYTKSGVKVESNDQSTFVRAPAGVPIPQTLRRGRLGLTWALRY